MLYCTRVSCSLRWEERVLIGSAVADKSVRVFLFGATGALVCNVADFISEAGSVSVEVIFFEATSPEANIELALKAVTSPAGQSFSMVAGLEINVQSVPEAAGRSPKVFLSAPVVSGSWIRGRRSASGLVHALSTSSGTADWLDPVLCASR